MNRSAWIATAAVVIGSLTPAFAAASPIPITAPQIISGPQGVGPAVVVTTKPAQWVAGTWWGPSADQTFDALAYHAGTGALPGDYLYRLTFDLTGYDPATATLSGSWSTDNDGSIYLNSVLKGSIGPTAYTFNTPFSFNSGFVAGINTLDFLVHNELPAAGSPWAGPNGQNPTGFHLEVVGVNQLSVEATAVPEPASLVLFGTGLVGLAALRRRKARR